MFSGFNKLSTVPAGSFLKAASVGAKTVNLDSLEANVLSKPVAFKATIKVLNVPAFWAVPTMLAEAEAKGQPFEAFFYLSKNSYLLHLYCQ